VTDLPHAVPSTPGFDQVAGTYDRIFEGNPITARIRPILWKSLVTHFKPGTTILELNCGTGTDAIHLAQQGIHVTATDASGRMIARGEEKARAQGLSHLIDFRRLPFEHLTDLAPVKFDGAFSAFGGLNCTPHLTSILETLAGLVKPSASIILCLINKVSLWEIGSFLLRGKVSSAFRRMRQSPVNVPVGNTVLDIFYYTPQGVTRTLSRWFTIEKIYGLNILSPSPNSRGFAGRHPKLTTALLDLDDRIRAYPPWHSLGDHFVIEARRNHPTTVRYSTNGEKV